MSALDDSSVDVQFIAVHALAEITKKDMEYSPTTTDFYANPTVYTKLWKQWWLSDHSANR